MGQFASSLVATSGLIRRDRFKTQPTAPISPTVVEEKDELQEIPNHGDDGNDDVSCHISHLPDECLAGVFQFLCPADRISCSAVCRRWLRVEGQYRRRLCLRAESDLLPFIPALFSRFDAVTKLSLRCHRKSRSVCDAVLVEVALRCRNLAQLKLRACRELTDAGVAAFARNCKGLRKLSCVSCSFGSEGMNAILESCADLEELSVKRLRGIFDEAAADPIGNAAVASSLRTICLKELLNGLCFAPLLIGSRNLKALKLVSCTGDWDAPLQLIGDRAAGLVEVHLEKVQVSDLGLTAISKCRDLEILNLVKTPDCTDVGLTAVAEQCKLLKKLRIDGMKQNRIGDPSLIAVAKCCPNLEELVLIGIKPTLSGFAMIASNCQNLQQLGLCGIETIGDKELSYFAAKCISLKRLCIKSCPISDRILKALACSCPSLVKVKVKKCKAVSEEGVDWLRTARKSVVVDVALEYGENDQQNVHISEVEIHENVDELPRVANHTAANILSRISSRSASFKARLGSLSGRKFMACTLRRWSSSKSSLQSN